MSTWYDYFASFMPGQSTRRRSPSPVRKRSSTPKKKSRTPPKNKSITPPKKRSPPRSFGGRQPMNRNVNVEDAFYAGFTPQQKKEHQEYHASRQQWWETEGRAQAQARGTSAPRTSPPRTSRRASPPPQPSARFRADANFDDLRDQMRREQEAQQQRWSDFNREQARPPPRRTSPPPRRTSPPPRRTSPPRRYETGSEKQLRAYADLRRSRVGSKPDLCLAWDYELQNCPMTEKEYKRASRFLHPDRNQGCNEYATEAFKIIGGCYKK